MVLVSPVDYQVVQRSTPDYGILQVEGSVRDPGGDGHIEVRALRTLPHDVAVVAARRLHLDRRLGRFLAELRVPAGGWYRLEARCLVAGTEVAVGAVEHVGVGDVFLVAGQSNSANHGEERLATETGLVATRNGSRWQLCRDPQPGASGSGGSFIPAFGDHLAQRLGVPIGIIAAGVGATSVREWLPRGTAIPSLPTLTGKVLTVGSNAWVADGSLFESLTTSARQAGPGGLRAVLWHQGESDANQADPSRTLSGTEYRRMMKRLIREFRREAGWEVPWGVALASYHTPEDPGSEDLRKAQAALWKEKGVFQGPDTDRLTGDLRDGKGRGVHFSGKGLREHGRLWARAVGVWMEGHWKGRPSSWRGEERRP